MALIISTTIGYLHPIMRFDSLRTSMSINPRSLRTSNNPEIFKSKESSSTLWLSVRFYTLLGLHILLLLYPTRRYKSTTLSILLNDTGIDKIEKSLNWRNIPKVNIIGKPSMQLGMLKPDQEGIVQYTTSRYTWKYIRLEFEYSKTLRNLHTLQVSRPAQNM